MASDEARRRRLIALCEKFAGKRWQTAVSKFSRVPHTTLSMVARGERFVTAELERAVAQGVIKGADEQIMQAKAAKAAAVEFLKQIEKEKTS